MNVGFERLPSVGGGHFRVVNLLTGTTAARRLDLNPRLILDTGKPTGYEKNIEDTRRRAHEQSEPCLDIRPIHSFYGRLPVECAIFQFRFARIPTRAKSTTLLDRDSASLLVRRGFQASDPGNARSTSEKDNGSRLERGKTSKP